MAPRSGAADLAHAFTEQARATPHRVAVSARDGALTYRELDERADATATTLLERGVTPGAVVAVLTGRTTALAVGVLAVLKAGGGYLPIDPTYPGERTADLIDLAGCSVVLATAELCGETRRRADTAGLDLLMLDGRRPLVPSGEVGVVHRDGTSLTYVLPTSGSTGKPKGVQIEDRNVLALVDALHQSVLGPLGSALRVAMVAPYVFDASVQQLFSALLLGHTLVIVPEQVRSDGLALCRFWMDERIDVSDGTPAHLRMIIETKGGPPVSVRHLLIGGDVLSSEVARRFLVECVDRGSRTTMTNVYGVAECCVDSVAGLVDPAETHDSVPIGHPLPGTVLTLLDPRLRPVPDGDPGEIHLGGAGVGRGYLGLPGSTANRFRSDSDGRRWYRTGDLARRLPDGRLLFLGRIDRQFILRGHRIEPGEIENALRRHAGQTPADVTACTRCLLTSAWPAVTVEDGVCSVCRQFGTYRDEIMRYFGGLDELVERIRERSTRERSGYDVLLLFSGGKDSTYALYRLLDLGFRVLAFTFDNGYISSVAFENIRRITANADVELEIGAVDAMDGVFAESLRNDSTVCSGCFRGLTAMSTKYADERGIGVVVTGLSRGQIFETKLRRLVESGIRDPEEIDRRLVVHRKVYHARRDRTSELLGISFADRALDDILFLDYFRYDDATTARVKRFLTARDPLWATPSDTGLCSTNCRINEIGIYVHSIERGYHNYASPLSWDCRLGVLEREHGIQELADVAPREHVTATLRKLGYSPTPPAPITDAVVTLDRSGSQPRICAFYVCARELGERELRGQLASRLPEYMIPTRFIRLDVLPVTNTGKVDLDALPVPSASTSAAGPTARPRSGTEERVAALWCDVLGRDHVGRDDDFFQAGGDSLTATITAGLISDEFGVIVPTAELFAFPTVSHAADLIDKARDGTRVPRLRAAVDAPAAVLLSGTGAARGSETPQTFLFPDVWGGVDGYRELAVRMSGWVWALPVPSMPDHVGMVGIDEVCHALAERILADHPGDSYHFGGWSFGGLLALGVAHQVTARGHRVHQLTVVDTMPPDPAYWHAQLDECLAFLEGVPAGDTAGRPTTHRVPVEVRRVAGSGGDDDSATWRVHAAAIAPVLRALTRFRRSVPAAEHLNYVYAEDTGLTTEQIQQWHRFSRGGCDVIALPGTHYSILRPPLVDDLAGCFRAGAPHR